MAIGNIKLGKGLSIWSPNIKMFNKPLIRKFITLDKSNLPKGDDFGEGICIIFGRNIIDESSNNCYDYEGAVIKSDKQRFTRRYIARRVYNEGWTHLFSKDELSIASKEEKEKALQRWDEILDIMKEYDIEDEI